ncbi:PA14 domain-containing protein [Niallia sp. MER 6]|uniref:PA14 domain-containing protein n=1 Tax=Niallia sp. MER 6 TaxID=2939567 RepID=UPI00288B555B|nr:PA14 domain-containing protein [Niallia sp. MER 6]
MTIESVFFRKRFLPLFLFLVLGLLLINPEQKEAEGTDWSGNFYNNKTMAGNPIVSNTANLRFNWKKTSPVNGIGVNDFSAKFEKNITVSNNNRNYFLHAYADDGIRMYLDNNLYIDNWNQSSGQYLSKVITNLQSGTHLARTEYYEGGGNAVLFADAIPFNTWIGYFYNNKERKGSPEDAFIFSPTGGKDLSFNYGTNKPNAKNIGKDNFSIKLFTYKDLPAGQYIISMGSDDGAELYIDDKKVLNKTKIGEDKILVNISDGAQGRVHSFRIEYVEKTGKSYLDFSIKPFKGELSTGNWLSAYYNSTNLTGTGNIFGGNSSSTKINNIFYNWGTAAPNAKTNSNNFSASYYKLLEKGNYFVHTIADDGISASVNGQSLFNRWSSSSGKESKAVVTGLQSAENILQVNYLEKSGKAFVSADALPFGQWIGYYYANNNLKGYPVNKQIIKGNQNGAFSFDVGYNAPISGVPKNNYSAQFITAMKLTAGEYMINSIADDGIRVYIDDKLVLDRWGSGNSSKDTVKFNISDLNNVSDASEKDVHWIKVQYLEKGGKSKLNFDIKSLSQSLTTNSWLNIFYPNKNVSGSGKVKGTTSTVQNVWKKNAPMAGIPANGFSASFLKKIAGNKDYFVSTYADDGIRVKVDGNTIINRWKNSSGSYDKGLITNLNANQHIIQADYYDNSSNAYVFADVQPLGNWIAYYYNNKNLSGVPVTAKAVNNSNSMTLTQDFGKNAPASGVNKDGFSARYITAKRLDAGEYVIRGLSDDGVRVYIDGQLVIDQWQNGSYREKATKVSIPNTKNGNIHWIEVRYYDNKSTAKFQFSLVPYKDGSLVDSSGWYAEYYPRIIGANENPTAALTDKEKPVIIGGENSLNKITDINFNWKKGTPDQALGTDKFSAIYKKTINISENTNYNFTVTADDGVVLEIDGEKVIDSWKSSSGGKREVIGHYLPKGNHTFVLKYYENTGNASIKFEMKKSKAVFTTYNYLPYSLNDTVNKQVSLKAQTDKKYKAYIREDYFSYISSYSNYGLIANNKTNVRGGTSVNDWVIGTFSKGDKVTILSKKAKDSSGKYWYEVDFYKYYDEIAAATSEMPARYKLAYHTWVNAGPSDVKYYLDPNNFIKDDKQKLQFLLLSTSASISEKEVNDKILKGKGILTGKAESFVEAGKKYGVNEIYLISHALLETGNGTSKLATGVKVSNVDGKAVTPKTVYNMYGIGAYDSSALKSGSEHAYKKGWTTPEKAIIGGAEFIGKNYINNSTYKQDTLYKMRWNTSKPGTHQYATDIGWASKQVSRMKSLYDMLDSYRMYLEIPRYK